MKNKSGFISGVVLTLLGVVLMVGGLLKIEEFGGRIIIGIYGLIALGVGIYLLAHLGQEGKIEQVRERNKKTKKVNRR